MQSGTVVIHMYCQHTPQPIQCQLARALLITAALAVQGCQTPGADPSALPSRQPAPIGTFAPSIESTAPLPSRQPGPIDLHLFLVQVPQSSDTLSPMLDQLLRVDGVDAGTLQRLERNGMRFGVGPFNAWDRVTAAVDGIEGHLGRRPEALQLPAGLPLYLELDETATSRTVFAVGFDGVLNGSNWSDSEAVLVVTQQADLLDAELVELTLAPGIRQRRQSLEIGSWPKPVFEEQTFDEASWSQVLGPDQFIAIWPSPDAALPQLIGAALFTRANEDVRYNSYVFMRFTYSDAGEAADG